jgi:histone deacetylase complex regulatory component SIN3
LGFHTQKRGQRFKNPRKKKMIDKEIERKIERQKRIAESIKKKDDAIFVEDFCSGYYFGHVLEITEDYVTIKCFSPKSKKGKSFEVMWPNIRRIDKYRRPFNAT